ncbi:MAG: 30S ribosome-binding factor RbfA [Verrucomicrobiae bacterium]|nr:30S ribosome-binding factor RbfA [Verrucomicrobiae bacterium]
MQRVRYERVRELLKRELGEIIRQEIPIEKGGVITVTDVGLAHDLQSAKVFVSLIGTEEQRKQALSLLRDHTIPIQNRLGRAVVLRYTPHLRFVVHDSIARGDRVLEILGEIERDSGES